jgi:hypothetical protein
MPTTDASAAPAQERRVIRGWLVNPWRVGGDAVIGVEDGEVSERFVILRLAIEASPTLTRISSIGGLFLGWFPVLRGRGRPATRP